MFLSILFLLSHKSKARRIWIPPPPVAPFTHGPLPKQKAVRPIIFPVIGKARWGKHYGVDHAYTRHTGIDIAARKMSPIVASFTGVLGFKKDSYWIYAEDGWMLLGTHLNDDNIGRHDHKGNRDLMFAPNLVPGMTVKAGQFIGYVGESGMATGPHLHFELYAPGKGKSQTRIRDPFASLRRAQVLKTPRIDLPNVRARPARDYVRLQACIRGVNPHGKAIRVIVLAKQSWKGAVSVVTTPRYISLQLSSKAVKDLGGWKTLQNMAPTRTVGLYLRWTNGQRGGMVVKAVPSPSIR